MKFSRILLGLLFISALNCSLPPVDALNVDYYGMESRIQPDGSVLHSVTLKKDVSVSEIEYSFRYSISDVRYESLYSPVTCQTRVTDVSVVSCAFTEHEEYDQTNLQLQFRTSEMLRKIDDNYEFSYFMPIEGEIGRIFNIVYLPPTSTLASEDPEDSFSPRDGKTLSDGTHIMIYWERNNLTEGEDIYFSTTYKIPVNSFLDIGLMVIIGLVIIAGLGAFYIQTAKKRRSVEVIMPLLKGDEKTVVDILKQHEGSVSQKVIVRESDFSKAKVSRIVADLRERGIIDVESIGRMNKITLKERD